MTINNDTKIKEILPIIDDIATAYTKHRAILGAAFGNMTVSQISEIITMFKGLKS